MIKAIIGLNLIVFAAWQWAAYTSDATFLVENFLVSWLHLQEGHFWTLLTSVFSHHQLLHLGLNMIVLFSFGPVIYIVLGKFKFIAFYLTAGVVASLSHCFVSKFLIGIPEQPALGASGAIAGLVLVFGLLFPREKIYLFGFIPLPALFATLAFVGIDIWGLIEQTQGGGFPIGHGAHLGGSFTGLLYFYFSLFPKRHRLRNRLYGGFRKTA